MSKLLINCFLFVTFFVFCGCAYARPKFDNYQDPTALKPSENNGIYDYPDDPLPESPRESHTNLLQALMNSRNPDDEAYVRYYKNALPNPNWPNPEWFNSNYQYGKRTSNNCER